MYPLAASAETVPSLPIPLFLFVLLGLWIALFAVHKTRGLALVLLGGVVFLGIFWFLSAKPVPTVVLPEGAEIRLDGLNVTTRQMATSVVQGTPRASSVKKKAERTKAAPNKPAGEKLLAEKPAPGATDNDAATSSSSGPTLPTWAEAPDARVGDAYEMTASGGPCPSDEQCQAELQRAMLTKLRTYVDEVYPGVATLQQLGADSQQLVELPPNLVSERFVETRQTLAGPMQMHYARLKFTGSVNRWIDGQLKSLVVQYRLLKLGVGLGVLLIALTGFWGYLASTAKRAAARQAQREQSLKSGPAAAILLLLVVVWSPFGSPGSASAQACPLPTNPTTSWCSGFGTENPRLGTS